ncbi:MAG: hypothetical protein Kow00124_28510 [Anaerolineae bacterium]
MELSFPLRGHLEGTMHTKRHSRLNKRIKNLLLALRVALGHLVYAVGWSG